MASIPDRSWHGSIAATLSLHAPAKLEFLAERWALLPPALAYFDLAPGRDWFDSGAAARPGVLHCVQRAGDMIFVPRNWGHAVLNLQTSVAVVHEY